MAVGAGGWRAMQHRRKGMRKGRAVILGGGTVSPPDAALVRKSDFLICCDGGLRWARRFRLSPSLLVGDLDSVSPALLKWVRERKIPVRKYPQKKDKTDLEIGIEEALSRHPREILLLGALNGRKDHELCNLFLLEKIASAGSEGKIVSGKLEISLVTGERRISGRKGNLVTLIPVTERVTGVRTEGLQYRLKGETLFRACSRGLSNLMTGLKAVITMERGKLFLFIYR